MIIRSGLIRNREGVSKETFDQHWREVHGPLARVVPAMRAYAQNHVLARLAAGSQKLHGIDGISQLWFDDVAAMSQAMASPEQAACVEDIKGFLDRVKTVADRQLRDLRNQCVGVAEHLFMKLLAAVKLLSQEFGLNPKRIDGDLDRHFVRDHSFF